MPRANRHFLPGYVWHIAQPLREVHLFKLFKPKASIKDFPFARDRRRYLHRLFEAKKRFGLCVLDYIVTSNHVHLVVTDTGSNAESM